MKGVLSDSTAILPLALPPWKVVIFVAGSVVHLFGKIGDWSIPPHSSYIFGAACAYQFLK
jgi:hypothetical protein